MSNLLIPRVAKSQPSGARLSDIFKPSKDALIFNAADYTDALTETAPARTLPQVVTPYGLAVQNTYNSGNKVTFPNRVISGNKVTFAVEFYTDGSITNWSILATVSTSANGLRLSRYNGTFLIIKGQAALCPSVSIPNQPGWYRAIAGNDANTGDYYIYLKNLTTGITTRNTTPNSVASNPGESVWSVGGGYDPSPTSNITVAYIDSVFKPYAEMSWFLDNPWGLFESSRPMLVAPTTVKPQFFLPRTTNKQLPNRKKLSKSNPIAKGVVKAFIGVGTDLIDALTGIACTKVGASHKIGLTDKGPGVSLKSNTDSEWTFSTDVLAGNSSIGWVGQFHAGANGIVLRDHTVSDGDIFVWNNAGGWASRFGFGGAPYTVGPTGTIANDTTYSTVTVGNGSTGSLYVDGKFIHSGTVYAPSGGYSLPWHLGVNGLNAQYSDSTTLLIVIWNRPLSEIEAKSFSTNPWQIFETQPKAITPPGPVVPSALIHARRKPKQQIAVPKVNWNHHLLATIDDVFVPTKEGHVKLSRKPNVLGQRTVVGRLATEITKRGELVKYDPTVANPREQWSKSGAYWTNAATFILEFNFRSSTGGYNGLGGIAGYYDDGFGLGSYLTYDRSMYLNANASLNGVFTQASLLVDDKVSFVAATYDSANLMLYAGGQIANTAATGSIRNSAAGLLIGSLNGGDSFNGGIGLVFLSPKFTPLETIKELERDPWQVFETPPRLLHVPSVIVGTPQLLVPVSDITKGTWSASSGPDLYPMLDETIPSSADYIYTVGHGDYFEVGLTVGNTPTGSGDYALSYQLQAGTGSGTIYLKQGATTIASWPYTQTGVEQTITQTLTAGQIAAITDYSNLRVGGDTN